MLPPTPTAVGAVNPTPQSPKQRPLPVSLRVFMDDEFLLPRDRLEGGDEIARGSFGAVSKAKLYGMAVCAKVCRGAALLACPLAPFCVVAPALGAGGVDVTGPSCSRSAASYIFV
jgi:hypothetical protein